MRHRILPAFFWALCLTTGVVLAQQPVYQTTGPGGGPVPQMTTTEIAHGATAPTWTAVIGMVNMERGSTTPPTAVTAGQPVAPWANLNGARGAFPVAHTVGGDDGCPVVTTASTNAFNCKGATATMYELMAINTTATLGYLRLYNTASNPTCSSATGFVLSIPVPASTSGNGVVRSFPVGRAFSTGISGCVTGGGTSTDNTNAPAGIYIDIGAK